MCVGDWDRLCIFASSKSLGSSFIFVLVNADCRTWRHSCRLGTSQTTRSVTDLGILKAFTKCYLVSLNRRLSILRHVNCFYAPVNSRRDRFVLSTRANKMACRFLFSFLSVFVWDFGGSLLGGYDQHWSGLTCDLLEMCVTWSPRELQKGLLNRGAPPLPRNNLHRFSLWIT